MPLALLLLAAGLTTRAQAMPPYQRMFSAKYKFKPSCALCHDPGNWDLNHYGERFFANGRDMKAFAAIEPLDPDEDGVSTRDEILARSNPGDPRSVPGRPGDWLKDLAPPPPPLKHLRALFPETAEFSLREGELKPAARTRVEKKLGSALRDEELYPVYFEAREGKKSLGAAWFGSSAGQAPCFFLVGYSRTDEQGRVRVLGLEPLLCSVRALRAAEYLAAYRGKTPEELGAITPPLPQYAGVHAEIVKMAREGAALAGELLR